jgi:hypothetical protein
MLSVSLVTLTITTTTADAQEKLANCSHKQPAKNELMCGKKKLHHADSLIRFLKQNTTAGTRYVREQLWKDALWLKGYAQEHIRYATQRLIPPIPHYSSWMCIHKYEGSWTDSGDPYWGGLQMDRGFMSTYGSDMIKRFHGLANVWPVWAQMAVAERAFGKGGRGYGPWPNTARACGLL